MTMRLIDAEGLKSKAIYMHGFGQNKYVPMRAIMEAPTITPESLVVHGKWIPFHSTHAGNIQYCSFCDIGCTWKSNYCPNCGCKMDLET